MIVAQALADATHVTAHEWFLLPHFLGITGFGAGALAVIYTLVKLCRARTVDQVRSAVVLVPWIKWIMIGAFIVTLGSGIGLVVYHGDDYGPTSPFYMVAIAALLGLLLVGALVLTPRMERVCEAAGRDGVTMTSLSGLTSNMVLHCMGWGNIWALVAFIPLMVLKMDLPGSVLIVLNGFMAGMVFAMVAFQPWLIPSRIKANLRQAKDEVAVH